jgi:hypothetical protein
LFSNMFRCHAALFAVPYVATVILLWPLSSSAFTCHRHAATLEHMSYAMRYAAHIRAHAIFHVVTMPFFCF